MPRKGVRVPQASRRARREYKNAMACAEDLLTPNERALAAAFWPTSMPARRRENILSEEEEKQLRIVELRKKEEVRRKRLQEEAKHAEPPMGERPEMRQPRFTTSKITGRTVAEDWNGNPIEEGDMDKSKVAYDIIDPLTFDAQYEAAREMMIADGIDPDEEEEYDTDEEYDGEQEMEFREDEIEEFRCARADGVLPAGCVIHRGPDGKLTEVSTLAVALADLLHPSNDTLAPEFKTELSAHIKAANLADANGVPRPPFPKFSPAMEAKLALKPTPKTNPPLTPTKSPPPALKAKLALKPVSTNSPSLPALPSSPPALEAKSELQPAPTFDRPPSPSRSIPAPRSKTKVEPTTTSETVPVLPPQLPARGRKSLALEPTLEPILEVEHSDLPKDEAESAPTTDSPPPLLQLDAESTHCSTSAIEPASETILLSPSEQNSRLALEAEATREPPSEPSALSSPSSNDQSSPPLPTLLRKLPLKSEATAEPSPTIDPPYSVPDPDLIQRQLTNERCAAMETFLSRGAASQRRVYRISDEDGVTHATREEEDEMPIRDYSPAEVELLDRMVERVRMARSEMYDGYMEMMQMSRWRRLRTHGRAGNQEVRGMKALRASEDVVLEL